MTNNRVVQCASGAHERMLRLTEDRHRRLILNADYRAIHGRQQRARHAGWDKQAVVNAALADLPDGAILTWLDADLVILDPVDFAPLLPQDRDAAMIRNVWGDWQAGVIVMRACAAVRRCWIETERAGPFPGTQPQEDQPRLNQMARAYLRVHELDSRYNHYPHALRKPSGPVVIRAFHCTRATVRTRLKHMEGCLCHAEPTTDKSRATSA